MKNKSIDVIIREKRRNGTSTKCWTTSNPYGLFQDGSKYVPFDNIMNIQHLYDFEVDVNAGTIVPVPIRTRSYSSIPNGLQCSWFGIAPKNRHTWYGNVGWQINFNTFLKEFKPECYFLDVVQFAPYSAIRLLFTTQDVSHLPNAIEYDPTQVGGPWYSDQKGNHWHLSKSRRLNSNRFNQNDCVVELVILFSAEEYKRLYELCKAVPVDHSQANEKRYFNCKRHNHTCPNPWDPSSCYEKLKERFPLLAYQGKLMKF